MPEKRSKSFRALRIDNYSDSEIEKSAAYQYVW